MVWPPKGYYYCMKLTLLSYQLRQIYEISITVNGNYIILGWRMLRPRARLYSVCCNGCPWATTFPRKNLTIELVNELIFKGYFCGMVYLQFSKDYWLPKFGPSFSGQWHGTTHIDRYDPGLKLWR